MINPGRGFLQARIEHFTQFTLADVSTTSGYHVLRRRRFNLKGLFHQPSGDVLRVARDQFGLWNVSGYKYPIRVFLLQHTWKQSAIKSARAQAAPSFGGASVSGGVGFQRVFEFMKGLAFGTVLTSTLADNESDAHTAWPGSDKVAVFLIATYEEGEALLWATRLEKRGSCLVFNPGCIAGKPPMLSRSCAEGDVQSTILALYVTGNPQSKERQTSPVHTGVATPATETGE